jgi:hypothetical protein
MYLKIEEKRNTTSLCMVWYLAPLGGLTGWGANSSQEVRVQRVNGLILYDNISLRRRQAKSWNKSTEAKDTNNQTAESNQTQIDRTHMSNVQN